MPTLVNVLHIFPEDNACLRDMFIRLVTADKSPTLVLSFYFDKELRNQMLVVLALKYFGVFDKLSFC